MENQFYSEELINDMILKYADESFNFRDAVKFEALLKRSPDYFTDARINRKIRMQLQSLPEIKASPGFEARLADRIQRESAENNTFRSLH